MSTVAQIEGLIKRYQTYYQVTGVSKSSKKEDIIGRLLTRLRPQDGRLVLAQPVWEDALTQEPVFFGLPDPTPADVAAIAKLSVPKLLGITRAYNDYYEIIKNYRDVTKPVKEGALARKVAATPTGVKDIMPPFAVDLTTLEIAPAVAPETAPTPPTAPVALPLEMPAPLDWAEPPAPPGEEVRRQRELEAMGAEDTQGVDKLRAKVAKAKAERAQAAAKAAEDAEKANILEQQDGTLEDLIAFSKNPHARCYTDLCRMSKAHEVLDCPSLKTLYCPVCASKGHSPRDCPNKVAWGVRTATTTKGLKNREMYVRDTPDGVANVLKEAGLVPTSPTEDRKTLHRLSNILPGGPRMVLFVNPRREGVEYWTL